MHAATRPFLSSRSPSYTSLLPPGAHPLHIYTMSSYSSQNNIKDDLDEQRNEFKQRVNARLEEDAKKDPNP